MSYCDILDKNEANSNFKEKKTRKITRKNENNIIERINFQKKIENKEITRKTKNENIIYRFYERKKFFQKKLKNFETKNSPEKKYYRNKNAEKAWKESNSNKEKLNIRKKEEIEERKKIFKKYEKMKIKKKDILEDKNDKNNTNEPDFNELIEKVNQKKKILTAILSKITIKTFLVITNLNFNFNYLRKKVGENNNQTS